MEQRIDLALVERGLCKSRSRAKTLLQEGAISLNGVLCQKPSTLVTQEDRLYLVGEDIPYVGRGGCKLEKALEEFAITPSDKCCMDIGASTGGFTDCMLQRGASLVYAIDVGHGQLDPILCQNPRVQNREGTDVRTLVPQDFEYVPQLATIDVSFISLTLVLPCVYSLLAQGGACVALVKPQFEAGRAGIGKRGIVKSARVHEDVLESTLAFAREIGFATRGLIPSPIRGGSGNVEYLLYLEKSQRDSLDWNLRELVHRAGVKGV